MFKHLFLTFLIISNVSFAQKDKQSQEILKSVSSKYKTYKTISATFRISIEDQKNKSNQVQNGSIIISGNKYNLSLAGQQIVSDGKTAWTYIKDANEVQINEAESKADGITPSNIFTIYEKGFDSRLAEEKTESGKAIQYIDLKPLDSSKPYFKIQLKINKNEQTIAGAKIFNNNGTLMTYTITKFTPNVSAKDTDFNFDTKKYPGIEVVDLR
jgi:outer membrane lipoprotein-sorting protein